MHHQSADSSFTEIQSGLFPVWSKAGMDKSGNPTGFFILSHNQTVWIPVRLRAREQLKDVARKPLGGVWTQCADMPQLMQLGGICVMERAIQHN